MALKKWLLMLLMIAAALAAIYLRPTHKMASDRQGFVLEQIIPKQFGAWREIDTGVKPIINPRLESIIQKIYSQTLSRTYTNDKGGLVMLVIAYGEDQSDSTGLHYPEVCYPSQGFQVKPFGQGLVSTKFGDVRVKRLIANRGDRIEPITYWTTIGNKVVVGNKETKFEKLKYGIHGVVPDGVLFRVSSVGLDSNTEFRLQQEFLMDIISNVKKESLPALIGSKAIAG